MKKITTFLVLVALFGCSGPIPTEKTGLEGKSLPSFNLLLMDSATRLNTNNIPAGKPILFFLFNPSCPFCRAQTAEIIKDMKRLSGIRICMIAEFSYGHTKEFADEFQLRKYPNITVGVDYTNFFTGYFAVNGVPYLAIYNKEKKLKGVLLGKVSTGMIEDFALK